MNNPHKNARLTPRGRAELVRRIVEEKQPVEVVAAGFGISQRTAHKWLGRFRQEGVAGLENRSSRPRRMANQLGASCVEVIGWLRCECRLTGEAIAAALSLARSTVAGWLTRLGLGRLASLTETEPARRYQRERPGELLHLDTKRLARFWRVGHRVTGDPRDHLNRGAGWQALHVAIDDASRLAYVEVLADEKRTTTAAFLIRALRWFKQRGIQVERVMTDNGSGYVAKSFRRLLARLRIKHLRTRPYTPKTNGKAERFIQTLMREWAYAIPYSSSDGRNSDLPRWLTWYNQHRPHVSLGRRSPAQVLAGTT
jgi:transposase InsO family protein